MWTLTFLLYILFTKASLHDVKAMDEIPYEPNALYILIMDITIYSSMCHLYVRYPDEGIFQVSDSIWTLGMGMIKYCIIKL